MLASGREIDWARVETFNDLKAIFATIFEHVKNYPDQSGFAAVERFLKPKPDGGNP